MKSARSSWRGRPSLHAFTPPLCLPSPASHQQHSITDIFLRVSDHRCCPEIVSWCFEPIRATRLWPVQSDSATNPAIQHIAGEFGDNSTYYLGHGEPTLSIVLVEKC